MIAILRKNDCYTHIPRKNDCYTHIPRKNDCYTHIPHKNDCYTHIPRIERRKITRFGHFGVLRTSAIHRAGHLYITLPNGLLVAVKPPNGPESDLGIIWFLRDHFSGHLGFLRLPATHRAA